MINVSKEEYDKELNKINMDIIRAEAEYNMKKEILYNRLLSYVKTRAPEFTAKKS